MPDISVLISVAIASFFVCIVPGSTVSAVVGTGLARGLKAGVAVEIGAQIGRLLMVLLVAVALEAVHAVMAWAFDIIKYGGAAYLCWLGLRFILAPPEVRNGRAVDGNSLTRQLISGLLVTWSNPKSFLFFGAFLPQFVDPSMPAAPQIILFGLIEMAIAMVTDSAYLLLAVKARDGLPATAQIWIDRVAGVVLIGAAIWLALQHR
jgi:threonine/homoserine/homoserine lactone efflux protein